MPCKGLGLYRREGLCLQLTCHHGIEMPLADDGGPGTTSPEKSPLQALHEEKQRRPQASAAEASWMETYTGNGHLIAHPCTAFTPTSCSHAGILLTCSCLTRYDSVSILENPTTARSPGIQKLPDLYSRGLPPMGPSVQRWSPSGHRKHRPPRPHQVRLIKESSS